LCEELGQRIKESRRSRVLNEIEIKALRATEEATKTRLYSPTTELFCISGTSNCFHKLASCGCGGRQESKWSCRRDNGTLNSHHMTYILSVFSSSRCISEDFSSFLAAHTLPSLSSSIICDYYFHATSRDTIWVCCRKKTCKITNAMQMPDPSCTSSFPWGHFPSAIHHQLPQ